MRVAVFRAAPDGARTAARLAALGHRAILASVIAVARTAVEITREATEAADAVVFTSAHAPETLAGDPALAALIDRPCWCVGARTTAAAKASGFTRAESGGPDAAHLADMLRSHLPTAASVLLLAGRDRKPILEDRLNDAGFRLRVIETYEAAAVAGWGTGEVAELGTCEAALHYSRRSADLAMRLAAAHGLLDRMRLIRHHCLSSDIADALRGKGLSRVQWPGTPDEESLLAGLATRQDQ